ncbi:MAG: hypothetical protein ACTSU5_20850 [Promethearchaeota archaeon]
MKESSKSRKKQLVLLTVLFATMLVLCTGSRRIAPSRIGNDIGTDDRVDSWPPSGDPMPANHDPVEKSNYTTTFNESFDDTSRWDETTLTGTGASGVTDGSLWIQASPDPDVDTLYYQTKVPVNAFSEGKLGYNISLSANESSSVFLFFYVYYGDLQTTELVSQYIEFNGGFLNWTTYEVDLPVSARNRDDVFLRILFQGTDLDWARVEWLNISTWEFTVQELADPIEYNQDQQINLTINHVDGFAETFVENNVTIRFNTTSELNESKFFNATTAWSNRTYTFTIGAGNLTFLDTIYYEVWIQNETDYHRSGVFTFLVDDNVVPTMALSYENYSSGVQYNESVQLKFNVGDDYANGGSGVIFVQLCYNNESYADWGDDSLAPEEVVEFGDKEYTFNIPNYTLSARHNFSYNLYVMDLSSNTANLSGTFEVDDNVKPNVTFHNVSGNPVQYNETLVVRYNITEPDEGSGVGEVHLLVKLNTLPSSATDYTSSFTPSTTPPGGSGTYAFDVDPAIYGLGDTIYTFVNATDNRGNSLVNWTNPVTVSVIDTYPPDVVANSNKVANVTHDQDKVLNFTITEATDAAVIDNDSLCLYYQKNDPTLSSPVKVDVTIPKFGGVKLFTIPETYYILWDTVYFQLNCSDLLGNNFSSPVYSFGVSDISAPQVTGPTYSNSSTVYYYDAFNLTFSMNEEAGGTGLQSARLVVKNGSVPTSTLDAGAVEIFEKNGTIAGYFSRIISFRINASCTTAYEPLGWLLNVTDVAGNPTVLTGLELVLDDKLPFIQVLSINDTGMDGWFEYYDNVEIQVNVSEDLQESGFESDNTVLELRYKKGAAPTAVDDVSDILFQGTPLTRTGGKYTFLITNNLIEFNLAYYVWFVVNDRHNNYNDTFANLVSFNVADSVFPTVEIDSSSNNASVTYCVDKNLLLRPAKDPTSSGIRDIVIYWKLNGDVTLLGHDGFFKYTYTNYFGGSFIELAIPRASAQYKAEDAVFVIIEVVDGAGHAVNTSMMKFAVYDIVKPVCVEGANNSDIVKLGEDKVFYFTVYDPGYDCGSSGLDFILFYYFFNWEEKEPSEFEYDIMEKPKEGTPNATGGTFTFVLTKAKISYYYDVDLYYYIVAKDKSGNTFTMEAKKVHVEPLHEEAGSGGRTNLTWLWVVIGIAGAGGAIGLAYFLIKRRDKMRGINW